MNKYSTFSQKIYVNNVSNTVNKPMQGMREFYHVIL